MKNEDDMQTSTINITGTMVAYYFICHRKVWLFSKGLNLENVSGNSDVIKGKIIHEERFKREVNKEVGFDRAKIDFLKYGDQVYVHEVKKSKKFEEAHIWQLKYYIYILQNKGINCSAGIIHYPESMRKIDVEFTEEDRLLLMEALSNVQAIQQQPFPPKRAQKKMCKRCAYFDFCYA
ncbi:MAG: CRISPR-associated protein Cas4 [Syntrophomonadaceae bacterium]|jgi:CRISPR-associated exonuclease Cas4